MTVFTSLPVSLQTIVLLVFSKVFMTFVRYGHLRNMVTAPWYAATLVSWSIASLEYMFQVPANRIGHTPFSVGQPKIIQEVMTLTVFVPFAVFHQTQIRWGLLRRNGWGHGLVFGHHFGHTRIHHAHHHRGHVGVGSTQRASAVRWGGGAGNLIWAWVLTIPASPFVAALAYWVSFRIFD
jgi:uncharacterized protein (DUF486 family)